MIIKLNKETVTPYGFGLNGEFLYIEIDSIQKNIVSIKIWNESRQKYANISELKNRLIFDNELNYIEAIYAIKGILISKGLEYNLDFEIKEDFDWGKDNIEFPIKISINQKTVIEYFSQMIDSEKAKGYPVVYKNDYAILYLHELYQEHREMMQNNNNILIEEIV